MGQTRTLLFIFVLLSIQGQKFTIKYKILKSFTIWCLFCNLEYFLHHFGDLNLTIVQVYVIKRKEVIEIKSHSIKFLNVSQYDVLNHFGELLLTTTQFNLSPRRVKKLSKNHLKSSRKYCGAYLFSQRQFEAVGKYTTNNKIDCQG